MKKLLSILLLIFVTDAGAMVGFNVAECKGEHSFLLGENEERFTFFELGIETFNVSLGNQGREVSFDSKLNGSVSAEVCMFYALDGGDTPNVDIYLNDNHTEADLLPNETEHTFWLNTTVKDNVHFKLRADVPTATYKTLTLTIYQNSTILLKETGEEDNAGDGNGGETNGNSSLTFPLTNSQLKVLLALSITVPLLFGIWAEKISRRAKRERRKEKGEDGEEAEVIM